jgi:hypothetical protein
MLVFFPLTVSQKVATLNAYSAKDPSFNASVHFTLLSFSVYKSVMGANAHAQSALSASIGTFA